MKLALGLLLSMTGTLLLLGCKPATELPAPAPEPEPQDVVAKRYGSWASPLSAAEVYSSSDELLELRAVGDGIYFSLFDGKSGHTTISRLEHDGSITPVVPVGFDVGSRIHEYGGGDFLGIGQSLFATRKSDQLFYRFAPNQEPLALTPNGTRHGDCISYPKGSRIICVREDHRAAPESKASLVTINLNFAGEGDTFVAGHDFISSPAINADNTQLAWLTWEHPAMPWDNTRLWLGELDRKGRLNGSRIVAGSEGNVSITEPMFGPDGRLYFIADYDDWWNLYRLGADGKPELLYRRAADFSSPAWRMGERSYAFEDDGHIIASYIDNGEAGLVRLNLETGAAEEIAVDFGDIKQLTRGRDGVYFIGRKVTTEKGIYRVSGRGVALVFAPTLPNLDPRFISRAQSISFRTEDNMRAWGYFYWPKNPHFTGLAESRPPLLVKLHGGPTAKASLAYRSDIQYWTSRGFAVLDLNFRGSSGFGRAYRQSLYGNWGKSDVEDAINAARFLVEKGWVDGGQMAISGSSAGGLTVLSALAKDNTFKAGVSRAGISDLERLSGETHKFEKSYLDQLIGPIATHRELYRARSPINKLERLDKPMLLLQGMKDTVVAPNQTLTIYQALVNKQVPVALLTFADENHNRWKDGNLIKALEYELGFYGQVFGFTPADPVPALNLQAKEPVPVSP
ncbi:prolyl oligopeptidase family serine peptidase [Shewanella sp. JM162201]|uniref:Prolyl oligopeptidase family serine peptidase n=1 Tax=Shewanella jiangmenensis TaxID=2837387 RepID=A0ABS5V3F7_9GAMM|nr:prolyl oligopeptidase family serine peptidase [Shewanella jiangmenensis]MBT1444978.1 prolyl oligopeptidase family serine peptidase [Shewanella jiangmenensis]